MRIDVSPEDYKFLLYLQAELNTQDTDAQAQPVYWGVLETIERGVPDGCGDPKVYMGDGACVSLEEAVNYIEEIIDDSLDDDSLVAEWAEIDKNNMEDVVDFAQECLDFRDWRIVYVAKEDKLAENTGIFFTKSACQKYIEANKHNLENPRTYAMTALRNREFERVVNILRTIRFE